MTKASEPQSGSSLRKKREMNVIADVSATMNEFCRHPGIFDARIESLTRHLDIWSESANSGNGEMIGTQVD